MNSYKLNGIAGHLTREAICRGLEIPSSQLYKVVKSIDYRTGIIILKDGRTFKLELKPYKDEIK